ncbi:thiamine pyrophosphate-binding protein [Candidatus Poribacteria bacterium]|jgi:acetolactate synthase I/II/III large subunit|nr:thiamine pyrophosphate-binding protein [Candidatus Poribacteria bacterium]MBT7099012.1 thiamine pyrophosphate-binding protein [Candidatus Poribacteria bacterium]
MNGAQWLVESLRRRGVERVFALCGNGLKPFLDACVDLDMPIVDVRNEQSAAFMADVWARMTGRLGVVAVSAGPGHTNALTGVANAYWDGAPVLLISASAEAATLGLGQFQELDQVRMAAPVCKIARRVDRVERLEHEVDQAVAATISGRPGPAHLTLPADVLSAPMPTQAVDALRGAGPPTARVHQRAPADAPLVRDAVKALAEAERPLMIVGNGAAYADAGDELRAFAARTHVPVLSNMWSRGCVDTRWDEYVGTTFGGGTNGAYEALAVADVLLVVGATLDYRVGFARPPAVAESVTIIRIDAEPGELAKPVEPHIGIVADARSALAQMLVEANAHTWSHDAWLADVRGMRTRLLDKWAPRGSRDGLPRTSLQLCRALGPFLDEDVTFLVDGGNIGRWANLVLWDRHPGHWVTCGASGVIGWGLAGAVAAKMARPDHPVLLLSGDGSAGFTLAEVETAIRFGTPYVAVIAHDGAWGIEADSRPPDRRAGTVFGEIRFDRVAQALGGEGVYIERAEELAPAIRRGLAADTVTFIHVPTEMGGVGYIDRQYDEAGA